MKNKTILIASLVLLLTSCSYHEKYPENWESFQTEQLKECPNISGIYFNEGISGNSKYKPGLAWTIFGESAPWEEATHVSVLQINSNKIDIKLWNNGKNIYETSLLREDGDFVCEEGLLKIDTRDYVNRDGVIGKEWSVLGFVKLENELIVKNENGAVGLFFLFPVAGTGTSWYKFKEKNKARMSR